MSYVVIDAENTTFSKGDAHDQRNTNVCWSYAHPGGSGAFKDLHVLQEFIDNHDIIVGFNLMYDLQWLWKLGIRTEGKKFWCCQVAEFILNKQRTPYPSLDEAAEKYTGEKKLDVVKTEYWDKGINTDEVPWPILSAYAIKDAELTEKVYLAQLAQIPNSKKNLYSIAMQDLVVLAEMRYNGMKYDKQFAENKCKEILAEIEATKLQLDLLHHVPSFNWASPDHLSALLYGGTIEEEVRIPSGFFKTGAKVGQTRYKVERVTHNLPRIYKPLPKTEAEKGGRWSTSEDILQKLDDGTALISGILKIRGLSKQYGTYFKGIPDKATESFWKDGMVYGQFNQCMAVTGRLSSSGPNMQNIPEIALKMFTSRFN
jgi:DNA polymerase I